MKKITRNVLVISLSLLVVGGIAGFEIYGHLTSYNYTWSISTPELMDMNATMLADMQEHIETDTKFSIKSLLIVKNDSIVFEHYGSSMLYGIDKYHSIWGATISFTGTLIGIAIDKGYLTLDDYVLDFFSDITIQNVDANKSAMQIRHLLTMTSGLVWDDAVIDLGHPAKTDAKVSLDGQMVAAPGTTHAYHSGLPCILMHILERSTGISAFNFALKYLLNPLDFGEFDWEEDQYGTILGGYHFAVTARDLAKLGLLFLHQGEFNGRRLISSEWLSESTSVQTNLSIPQWGYEFGFNWWIWEIGGISGYSAQGIFDQLLMVVPDYNMVIVAQCNHPFWASWSDQFSQELVEDYILPAVLS